MPNYMISFEMRGAKVAARSGDFEALGNDMASAQLGLIEIIKQQEINVAAVAATPVAGPFDEDGNLVEVEK